MTFTIPSQMCSGKNRIIVTRDGRRIPDKRFLSWIESSSFYVPSRAAPWAEPVQLKVRYTPGDLKRRDADGMMAALFHLLERTGLVRDDALIQHITWTTLPLDRTAPKVEVAIRAWSENECSRRSWP